MLTFNREQFLGNAAKHPLPWRTQPTAWTKLGRDHVDIEDGWGRVFLRGVHKGDARWICATLALYDACRCAVKQTPNWERYCRAAMKRARGGDRPILGIRPFNDDDGDDDDESRGILEGFDGGAGDGDAEGGD